MPLCSASWWGASSRPCHSRAGTDRGARKLRVAEAAPLGPDQARKSAGHLRSLIPDPHHNRTSSRGEQRGVTGNVGAAAYDTARPFAQVSAQTGCE